MTGSVIDDDDGEEAGVLPIAVVAFVLALVLLAIQLLNFMAGQA